jgi:sulfatase maturation enzyme AslB (radical SAM superfamily)
MRQARNRKITRITKCTTCGIKALCGMCPALGELENGDAEEPVDYLCRVGHLRTKMLGRSVPAHGDCSYCEGGMT